MTTAHTPNGLRYVLEFIEGLVGPNFFPITENRITTWSELLKDLNDEQLAEGVRRACSVPTRGQPPLPADIITAVLGRWVVEPHPGCDNFGSISPENPKRPFHIHKDFSGAVSPRAFTMDLQLIEWPSQKILASR